MKDVITQRCWSLAICGTNKKGNMYVVSKYMAIDTIVETEMFCKDCCIVRLLIEVLSVVCMEKFNCSSNLTYNKDNDF